MLNTRFARRTLLALAASFAALPALAHDGIAVTGAYAYPTLPSAMSAAAYLVIENHTNSEDRLISVRSDIGARTQVHTNKVDANGVMKMTHLIEGILIPAGEKAELKSGGDHVMFMGLQKPFVVGESFPLILLFQKAGEIVVDVPIIERSEGAPAGNCPSHDEHEGHDEHAGHDAATEEKPTETHHHGH